MCGNGRKGVYSSVKFCKNEFSPIFRYSAGTRVVIGENCVRIVQRMKNPAAGQQLPTSGRQVLAEPKTKISNSRYANSVGKISPESADLKNHQLSVHLLNLLKTLRNHVADGVFLSATYLLICSTC